MEQRPAEKKSAGKKGCSASGLSEQEGVQRRQEPVWGACGAAVVREHGGKVWGVENRHRPWSDALGVTVFRDHGPGRDVRSLEDRAGV